MDAAVQDAECCDRDGCTAPAIRGGSCLAHLDEPDLKLELADIRAGVPIRARGVDVTPELLTKLLETASKTMERKPKFPDVDFTGATFPSDADFSGTTFNGPAGFSRVSFRGRANFSGATFNRAADFSEVQFRDDASFGGATFGGSANFRETTFSGKTDWNGVTFTHDAILIDATFKGTATFKEETSFAGDAFFLGASFEHASFAGVTFHCGAFFGPAMVRGTDVRITQDILEKMLRLMPPEGALRNVGASFTGGVSFWNTTFDGHAFFMGVTFGGGADFDLATFNADAHFELARFGGDARFPGTNFRDVYFRDASFDGLVSFAEASFDNARFSEATFEGDAFFWNATFSRNTQFDGARFGAEASFAGSTFDRDALFDRATFRGDSSFDEVAFGANVDFGAATFEAAQELGRFFVGQALRLDEARFARRVELDVSARAVIANRATFAAGVLFRVRWAEVALDGVEIGAPSILYGSDFPGSERDLGPVCIRDERRVELTRKPRLVSLREANVAALTLSNLDLRPCRFHRAHNLDALRIDSDCTFALTPRSWQYTRRQTLAEEHHWRAANEQQPQAAGDPVGKRAARAKDGWHGPDVQPPRWLEQTAPVSRLDPAQIAALYRALRKAREDVKDEPGAADFYYGEMEMRRHATEAKRRQAVRPVPSAERAIIWLYWLLSGYSLRASRSLVALVVLVGFFTTTFYLYGFRDRSRPYATVQELQAGPRTPPQKPFPPSLADVIEGWGSLDAWTYSAGTATAVIGAPDARLTQEGRAMRIPLRVLGPVFIGLGLLAIRGRVKR
jgi:uncharacterized protein YjbI with pentapeptide repeats